MDAPFLYLEIADTLWRRFFGLMGRERMAPSHALLLHPCSGVHTCFMRFSVDVAYLKRRKSTGDWQVIKVARGLRPWFAVSVCIEADAVLEMAQGEAVRLGVEPGTVWEEIGQDA